MFLPACANKLSQKTNKRYYYRLIYAIICVDQLSQLYMNAAILERLGMTTKEANVYMKLLELGSSGAHSLARRIEENRTTTYSLLLALQKKGMVSTTTKHGIKEFVPADPRVLVNKYVESGNTLKTILPELLAIYHSSPQKPKITFYEGLNGIIQLAETLLEFPGSTRESFMGLEENRLHPEMKRYIEGDFLPRRIDIGCKYRGIVTGYLPISTKHKKDDDSHLRELRYVDPKIFPLKIHIDIYPTNRVALYSYHKDEMMGVIIEHESFYTTMKTAFALAWIGAGK